MATGTHTRVGMRRQCCLATVSTRYSVTIELELYRNITCCFTLKQGSKETPNEMRVPILQEHKTVIFDHNRESSLRCRAANVVLTDCLQGSGGITSASPHMEAPPHSKTESRSPFRNVSDRRWHSTRAARQSRPTPRSASSQLPPPRLLGLLQVRAGGPAHAWYPHPTPPHAGACPAVRPVAIIARCS